ncbi:MAG: carboxypeptidase regulatory-like domain-containing protein [Thiobacillus sp.]
MKVMRLIPEGVKSIRACRRVATRLFVFLLVFASALAQAAPSPEIQKGLDWLQAQVQADGSLAGESASLATPMQGRTETLASLKLLATIPAPLVNAIAGDTEDNTEYLARQAISLSFAGQNTDTSITTLLARQNADGGFGGALGYESNPLDTAWAMLALNAANSNNSPAILAITNYLLASQDAGGGYSVSGNSSHLYITAIAATALQVSSNSPATANALNKANTWVLSHQSADGSWGDAAETSVVYLALLGSISDSGLQSGVTAYLVSQQGIDGSWDGDSYVTTLALRALSAQPKPAPTTGNVVLHVVDGSTGQALAGASAIIQGTANAPSVSDISGKISFSAVTAGTYTMAISAAGYATQSLNFTLQAGTTIDLGVVKMPIAPVSGILKGVVKNGSTGTALADVTISVTGSANATAVTSSDGSYSLTGLAPGAVTVSASKAGYASVGGTGTIVAGSVLVYSPSLSLAGQSTGTTGSILGQVVDAVSLVPLAEVTVSVETTGISATSGADGHFNIAGIAAGTYPVSFSLDGYATKSFAAVLLGAGSATDFQMVGLDKATNTVALQGKVTDINSGKAINQATVTVLGTPLSAVTDNTGAYRIEGLEMGPATLRFSAPGYTSETVAASFTTVGEFRLDKTLSLDDSTNLKFISLTTGQASYPAYAPVTVQMEIVNNGAQSINDAVVDITIFDPQGQVVSTQDAIRLDTNGVAQNHFTFPPNITTAVDEKWSTQSYAPGTYQIKARVFTEDVSTGTRTVLAVRTVAFTIVPSQTVLRLNVTPLPAFTTLDATEQMYFKVEASHQSNQPVTTAFKYQFKTPAGSVLKEEEGTLSLQPNDVVGSVILGPFLYHFTASGAYPVVLTSTGDIVPQVVANGEVQVAPGIRIEPVQIVAPNIVTPDGNKRIRIQLQLKGVEQK